MDWKIDYLDEHGIIHTKMSGVITWDENKKMSEEVFSFARSKDSHRYLLEHPQIEHKLSFLQIDDLPKLLKEVGLRAEDKLAVLACSCNPCSKELKFFENVSRLASLQVRHFTDFEQAVNWLKSD
ncbi:MAG: hypothetical protein WC454_06270 [Phycisphaerae bacterium]|jgi:hypothetical protein